MNVVKARAGQTIILGRLGENEYTCVEFDVKTWVAQYPNAYFAINNQRPGDTSAYPVSVSNIEVGDGVVYWTITGTELSADGNGKCQLVAMENNVIAKTAIFDTLIFNALDGSGTPPAPWESWQTAFEEMAQRAETAADNAEESANHYPKIENGYWYVWDPMNEEYTSTDVEAQGPIGETGAPGFSPTVTVTDIVGGHRVSVVDADGTKTFDIMDGATGDAGFSPIVEVVSITGGHRVTITDDDGTHMFDVMDGETGDSGATFVPTVSDDGIISWTNDKGLPNPESKNIRGPEGPQGIIGMRGLPGYTFTPTVSEEGVISWQNDGVLPNPDPINIKGADGINGTTFTPSVNSAGVISWTNDGGKQNPAQVNIKGPSGTNGVDGITFTPTVSGAGIISWTNDGGKLNPTPVDIKGKDGVSPVISVTDITGGHRITITDADGPHVFDVMDGAPGSGATIHICTANEYDPTTRVPTVQDPEDNVFYLVPAADGTSPDMFVEWIYTNNVWEMFGSASIDLSGYQEKITASGMLKGNGSGGVSAATAGTDYGTYSKPFGGIPASDLASGVIPDVPVQDVQVNGTSILDAQGVANVPVASSSTAGVVKTDSSMGTSIYEGRVFIAKAESSQIKNPNASGSYYRPIVPYNQHESVFFGLSKVAGEDLKNDTVTVGTYPAKSKSAISQMLNSPVTITGTTPTITALPGIRYICGEVSTLDITLPASGIVDVVFESGTTPTVLTITPPSGVTLKWANGFDPTALEADTTYEINVADGLGVAGQWS